MVAVDRLSELLFLVQTKLRDREMQSLSTTP